jgi:DNA repair protein RadC
LSTAELLAIVLRTGTPSENVLNLAARLLAHYGGLAGLARASFSELCAQHGVGQAKAAQAKAALELGRRLLSSQPQERATVHSPQVMDIPEVYRGSVHASLIRVGEVFREAVRQNCPAVIVVHNHPSGDPAPSTEDIEVTEQMVAAGKMLDIEVLDHIVIGQQRYVSLKERGLGFG